MSAARNPPTTRDEEDLKNAFSTLLIKYQVTGNVEDKTELLVMLSQHSQLRDYFELILSIKKQSAAPQEHLERLNKFKNDLPIRELPVPVSTEEKALPSVTPSVEILPSLFLIPETILAEDKSQHILIQDMNKYYKILLQIGEANENEFKIGLNNLENKMMITVVKYPMIENPHGDDRIEILQLLHSQVSEAKIEIENQLLHSQASEASKIKTANHALVALSKMHDLIKRIYEFRELTYKNNQEAPVEIVSGISHSSSRKS